MGNLVKILIDFVPSVVQVSFVCHSIYLFVFNFSGSSGAVGLMFLGGGGQVHHFSDKQIFCDITNSGVRKCLFD